MEQNDTLTRSAYLEGKKVLTDDDIANLIEIHNEYPDVKTLKRYTDKKYRELNTDERTELITSLLNDEEYLQYKNCHIAKSKLLYDADSTLIKEIETLSKLNDLGYEIYLLPYGYARDDMNCFKKSADSITEGDFLEIKQVISTNDRAGQGTYEDSRKQADNVFMSIKYDVPEEKIINNIHRSIGNIKKGNKEKGIEDNFEGLIFLHFEQTGNTSLYQVSREGRVNKLESANIEVFKKIKGTAYDSSQVVENPMTEHGSSRTSNIAQNLKMSNENTKDSQLQELERKLEEANKTIQSQNSTIQTQKKQLKEQDQKLHGKTTVVVNGVERTINDGFENGMKKAIARLDEQIELNKELTDTYNELVKSQNQSISPSDDGHDR